MISDTGNILIAIVSASFLLDSVLLTMVVPIIPDFLLNLDNEEASLSEIKNLSNTLSPQITRLDADSENGRVGILLSSKAIVQLVMNPLVGHWTATAGYSMPLFAGTGLLFLSTVLFAAGNSYVTLFLARMCQGFASACIGVTGMCLIADSHCSEPSRSRAMGFVLGSAACGVLIGYPFGGFMYDLFGKSPPFIIIATLVFTMLVTQFYWLERDEIENEEIPKEKMASLLLDRRILICGGTIGVSTTAMAILEPCLPIWLLGHIKPKKWQLGTAFIPDSLGYVLGTNSFSQIAYREGRNRVAVVAMLCVAISCISIPLASNMLQLAAPHFLLGLGIGAVDAALVPLLASLADTRQVSSYGAVYSLQQSAVCLAYALGPMVGGVLVQAIGFPWLMTSIGLINLLYCPLVAQLDTKEDRRLIYDIKFKIVGIGGVVANAAESHAEGPRFEVFKKLKTFKQLWATFVPVYRQLLLMHWMESTYI